MQANVSQRRVQKNNIKTWIKLIEKRGWREKRGCGVGVETNWPMRERERDEFTYDERYQSSKP